MSAVFSLPLPMLLYMLFLCCGINVYFRYDFKGCIFQVAFYVIF